MNPHQYVHTDFDTETETLHQWRTRTSPRKVKRTFIRTMCDALGRWAHTTGDHRYL